MLIEILGPGCPRCKKTYDMVKEYVQRKGIDAEVMKFENIEGLASRGVMMTPAVAVDGIVKLSGKIPSEDDLAEIFGK